MVYTVSVVLECHGTWILILHGRVNIIYRIGFVSDFGLYRRQTSSIVVVVTLILPWLTHLSYESGTLCCHQIDLK